MKTDGIEPEGIIDNRTIEEPCRSEEEFPGGRHEVTQHPRGVEECKFVKESPVILNERKFCQREVKHAHSGNEKKRQCEPWVETEVPGEP